MSGATFDPTRSEVAHWRRLPEEPARAPRAELTVENGGPLASRLRRAYWDGQPFFFDRSAWRVATLEEQTHPAPGGRVGVRLVWLGDTD